MIVLTIKQNETKGIKDCHKASGESGEKSCYQFMPKTYAGYSKQVLGYVAPMTPVNAEYVATVKVQEWLNEGRSPEKILLAWNAGEGATKCKKGVNKLGVKYDSCSYVKKGLQLIETAYAEEL